MAGRPTIPARLRRRIEEADGRRRGYCRGPMMVGVPMVVEHIVPLVAGGASSLDNLCLSCYRCNEYKGPRRHAPDPETGQVVALFHPRQQRWAEHFAWEEDDVTMRGLTPCGCATVVALRLNNAWLLQARRIWKLVGL